MTMKEEYLHFIWKHRRFSHAPLFLVNNSELQILKVGQLNTDSGPDFVNSKISLNGLIWVGSVEIHNNSSDWEIHNHQTDENYNSVILHVVWKNDKIIYNQNGEQIPTLVLSDYVEPNLIDNIVSIIDSERWIPCQKLISDMDSFILNKFLERIFIERLEFKSEKVALILSKTFNSWDDVLYQLICESFGLKVNSIPMLRLSELIPYKLLLKQAKYFNVKNIIHKNMHQK